MADIFDKLTTQKQDAPQRDIFDSILANKQGGDNNSEKDINQPEANSDRNAQREANEQVQSSDEGGVQASEQRIQTYAQQRMRQNGSSGNASQQNEALLSKGDIFDQLASKGGGKIEKGKQINVQAKDGGKGQEDGQGLRLQSNAGNEAEITDEKGGVQSPTQNYLQRLVSSAKENPSEALTAAGASAAESGVALGVGSVAGKAAGSIAGRLLGSVAAAAAVPLAVGETASTGGLGALAVPAIEMGAFAAGAYLGDKATQLVEKMIGADKAIEQAKEDNPELAQVASLATMAPMAVGSLTNLAKMGAKEAGKQIIGGAIGGAAFEPVRYGVESALKAVTGSDQDVSPITLGSEAESALMGAVLSAHGAREIEKDVGPFTAREAVKTETDPAIEERAKARQAEIEASVAELTKGTEYATKTGEEQKGSVSEYPYGNEAWKATETGYSHSSKSGEEGEEEVNPIEGKRIYAAAYRDPDTGIVHIAEDHETAESKAGIYPQKDPNKRNTNDYGFVTEKGEFISREDAKDIAIASDQYETNRSGQLVMHSADLKMDIEKEQAAEPTPEAEAPQAAEKPRPLGGAAAVGEFEKNNVVEATRLLRDSPTSFDRNNPADFEKFKKEYTANFDEGTFEGEQGEATLKQIYDKAQDAFEIHDKSKGTIPIEKAVDQVGVQEKPAGVIATKNAQINEQRAKNGLPPVLPGREITNQTSWNEAARRMQEDPQYASSLVTKLKEKPSAVSAEDELVVAQHLGELQHEQDQLLERHNKETDPDLKRNLRDQLDDNLKKIDDASQVYRHVGTEASGALRVRRILAAADFSLPRLLARRQKAEGRELTDRERREEADKAEKYKDQQRKVDEAAIKAKEANQNGDIDSFIDQATSEAKTEKAKAKITPEKKPFEPV